MPFLLAIFVTAAPLSNTAAAASDAPICDAPICLIDVETLTLARIVTFDDQPSSFGVGRQVEDVLHQPGVSFGERFLGQALAQENTYDRIVGQALSPLTILPGAPGQTLGIMRLIATSVLHGQGPAGFPKTEAAGEGAIAVLFENDQSALAFDIRGGELGYADITFLRRDGHVIHSIRLGPLSESSYGFIRSHGAADIAGLIIENSDPQGIAVDNVKFDHTLVLSLLRSEYAPISATK